MDKLSWLPIQVIIVELMWEEDINIWRQMVKPKLWHERTSVASLQNLAKRGMKGSCMPIGLGLPKWSGGQSP